ncbi:hypothetical protein C8J57DRAFT_1077977 [Mycena rebaudengoi]|nr:hypothetical protein C8J57DRAFT_1077977 [Mycena rebaudengoi]
MPSLSWGLILGRNLVRFTSRKGTIQPAEGRLLAILVSVAWHLRVSRVIENPDRVLTQMQVHNQWATAINAALRRDRLLTDRIKFGPLALKKQLILYWTNILNILNTWSGLLMEEDSLPDDRTSEGVLVGMRPMTNKLGIG